MKSYEPHLIVMVMAAAALGGCMRPAGHTAADRRAYVEILREHTIEDLFREQPQTEQIIEQAAGYGVFSNVGTQFLWSGTRQGFGVVVNNETDERTYMRMAGIRGGIGLGIQGYRAVFVFNDALVMHRFVTEGWSFGGTADATATTSEQGMAVGGQQTTERSILVYQLTDTGVLAAAAISGSRYWPDNELNE